MDEVQKRRVTLLDIAADAGVSRATASLVIRNVPSVAETTRKRVLRSIKRLGYNSPQWRRKLANTAIKCRRIDCL